MSSSGILGLQKVNQKDWLEVILCCHLMTLELIGDCALDSDCLSVAPPVTHLLKMSWKKKEIEEWR